MLNKRADKLELLRIAEAVALEKWLVLSVFSQENDPLSSGVLPKWP